VNCLRSRSIASRGLRSIHSAARLAASVCILSRDAMFRVRSLSHSSSADNRAG
jgi:hypothetical protein